MCECIGLCVYSYLYVRNQLVYVYKADIGGMIILKPKTCQSKILDPENDLVYIFCAYTRIHLFYVYKADKGRMIILNPKTCQSKILNRENDISQVSRTKK